MKKITKMFCINCGFEMPDGSKDAGHSQPISLNCRDVYDLVGITLTLHEIQQAVIDAKYYKETLQQIVGGKIR